MTSSLQADEHSLPTVSVIIPTYNRKDSLLRTLDSISRQTYPAKRVEVIVVDDGGTDGSEAVMQLDFPFELRYVKQANQGDAHARNRGAQEAKGAILQFLDDDIILDPGFLAAVMEEHSRHNKLMVIGRLPVLPSAAPTVFERVATAVQVVRASASGDLDFTEILSGVLSLRREHYLTLGMMQPVASSGSSVWCDVEFSYRAQREGFSLWRAGDAVAYHDDYALRDLAVSCRRAYRSAEVGAALFKRHPELKSHIPMFHDKGPIAWCQEPPTLIMRKLARQAASSRPAMWAMERSVPTLERRAPRSKLLTLFYRWIISGYIFRGYRDGLRQSAQPTAP